MNVNTTIVDVDAPAPHVWAVLADVTSWPTWTPTMTEVRLLAGDRLEPAGAAEIRQPRLPKALWRVTELEPGSRFVWATERPGIRTVAGHHVEPRGDRRCRVTLSIEITGPLSRLVSLVLGRLTRGYVETEAACLK